MVQKVTKYLGTFARLHFWTFAAKIFQKYPNLVTLEKIKNYKRNNKLKHEV